MKHDLKTEDGRGRSRTGRKERPHVPARLFRRRNAFGPFFEALRLSGKTAVIFALAACLALFSGCAAADRWPAVDRLEDGRQGFVIREKPDADAETRAEFQRAVALLNNGRNDAAIELLNKVIERSPGFTAPHIDIAVAYHRSGNPDQAEQHLKAALTLVPGHPAASNEYGLLLRKAGRFQEAREIYERAIGGFPDFPPARRNLGILCDLYLNDPQCALEQFERYSKLVPADEKVRMWVAELRMRLGKN